MTNINNNLYLQKLEKYKNRYYNKLLGGDCKKHDNQCELLSTGRCGINKITNQTNQDTSKDENSNQECLCNDLTGYCVKSESIRGLRVIVKNLENEIKKGNITKLPPPPEKPQSIADKNIEQSSSTDSSTSSIADNKAKFANLFKPPPGFGKPPSQPTASATEMSDDGLPALNPKIKTLERIGVPCGKLIEEIRNSELPDWDTDKMDIYFNNCCIKKKKTRGEVKDAQETDMSCLDNKMADSKYKLPLFTEQKLKITKSDKPRNNKPGITNQEHKLLLSEKIKERSSKTGIDIEANIKKKKEEKERLEETRLEEQKQDRIKKSEERARKVQELDRQRQMKKDLYDEEAKKKGEN